MFRELNFFDEPPPKKKNKAWPGGVKQLAKFSGVPAQQILIEKYMPVNMGFTRKGDLPSPGQATAIQLKGQLPLEEDFLKGMNPVLLKAEDQLVLVMFLC